MSLQTPTTYNPEAIDLIIDGVPIDGLSEDGIQVEREAESEITEGMDSGITFEWDPSRTAMVTVSVRAASAGAKQLANIQRAVYTNLRAGNAHSDIAGIAVDPINGSSIKSATIFFLNEPLASFQKQSGTLEFKIAFVNYLETRAQNV